MDPLCLQSDTASVDSKRFALDETGTERVVMEGRCRRGERITFLGPAVDGLEHGVWEFWSYQGELAKRAEFQMGRLVLDAGQLAPAILPDEAPDDSRALQETRSSLESPIILSFDRAPLEEAFAFIAELHDIPVRLDADACRRADVAPEQEITLDLRSGCTLRAALQIVAAEAGLVMLYRDGALVATPGVRVSRTE
jgi:hypothetical protein